MTATTTTPGALLPVQWCAGWIPDTTERTRRRRCGVRLDPALVAAGYDTHPMCLPRDQWGDLPAPAERAATLRAAGVLMCGPRPPAAGDLAQVEAFSRDLAARAGQVDDCPGCGHKFHRDTCIRKGASRCMPVLDPATGRQTGIACSSVRGPCPCPYGACHDCGAPIVGASPLPLDSGAPEIDIDRGSAGAGALAVRQLADGTLAVRRLAGVEEPAAGEWRGREHAHQLDPAASTPPRRHRWPRREPGECRNGDQCVACGASLADAKRGGTPCTPVPATAGRP
jgi:hypothetical protein